MASRVLETVLTARNELSPELNRAARDVQQYADRVDAANRGTAASAGAAADASERAADRIVESNAKVSRSSTDAQQQIEQLRRELTELGATTAKPDVDTTAARTKLDELRIKLAEVAASDPTAQVDADVAGASAQIQVIQAELNRIDGETVTAHVQVDDGGSIARASSSISGLKSLAAGLAPALIPLGAVGLAGGLAAGAGAVASAPVLASAALGYANVADAVKLLNNQQMQSTLDGQKAATQAASTAAAQSSAARQVQSSEAALANARANADDANVRAAGQVAKARQSLAQAEASSRQGVQDAQVAATKDVTAAVKREQDAQRDLASAQRDTRQAVSDLTAAEKTAQQQFEDTTNSVADNTLSQRQAVLDLADAEKDLETARASGDPDKIARATLAYDQQVQRQKELVLQGQRLQAQQDENTRTGVEGSATVVAAQQRVIDARVKETDAARNASNAAEEIDEARADGARDVAKAQQEGAQKVAAAQQTVSDAVQAQASQQRQSAYSIQQAQAQVAAAHQAAAAAAVKADDDTSESMARIKAQLDLLNPATVAFAGYVQTKLAPAWQALQQANAGELLPRTQQALDILMTRMPEATDLTKGFSRELGNLEIDAARALTGPWWTQFFDDIEHRGVPILDDFAHSAGNLAGGAAGIVQAFLPMGTSVAGGIEEASQKFEDWGQKLKDSEGFHDFERYVQETWPHVRDTIANVAEFVGKLVQAGAPIGGAILVGFQLLSGVLSALPVPVVQALLVAFLGFKAAQSALSIVDGFGKSFENMGKQVEGLPGKVELLNGALGGLAAIGAVSVGTKIATDIDRVAKAGKDAKDTIEDLKKNISEADTPEAKFQTTNAALDLLKQKAADAQKIIDGYNDRDWSTKTLDAINPFSDGGSSKTIDAKKSLREYKAAIDELTPSQQQMAGAIKATGDASGAASPQVDTFSGQLWSASDAAEAANRASSDFKDSLDALTGAHVTQIQAESQFYDALQNAKGALQGVNGAVLDGKGDLDLHTDAGRKTADALVNLHDKANDVISTMIAQGATADQARDKDAQLRKSFYDTAYQMTGSKDAAQRLTDQIYGIPAERETVIKADVSQPSQYLKDLQAQIDSMRGKNIEITVSAQGGLATYTTDQRNLLYSGGKATGGPISGPGTGTSDTAGLYALSNGEHVWTAREVSAAGGHTAMEAMRQQVLAAGRGRADGGPVGSARVNVDIDQTQVDAAIAAMQEQFAAGPSGGAGVERWRNVVLQALGMDGQPATLANTVLRRMNQESGGNPTIVNRWDSNWAAGTPSVGLMQVIGPTYRAHRDPRHDVGPYSYGTSVDPLSNVLASFDYAMDRYGSLAAAFNRSGGYDSGGIANGIGVMPKNTLQPERVLSPQQTQAFEQWMTSPAAMPGYGAAGGIAAASASPVTVLPPDVQVQVLIDGQEFKGMAQVVVDGRLTDLYRAKVRT